MMGRRILRLHAGFLPVPMSKGVHHYFVGGGLPEDCHAIEATVKPDLNGGELVLLLESDEFEHVSGAETAEIHPSFVKHHCTAAASA